MKRANGSGTVVKLSGNRRRPYAVRVSVRDGHGYVTQITLGYYAKAAEAQQALDDYNAKRAAGQAPTVDKLAYTVGQIYDLWSARKYAKAGKSSIQSYKASWNRISRLKDKKMRSVTLNDWQSIIDEDEQNGLSASSIQNDRTCSLPAGAPVYPVVDSLTLYSSGY